ncbi:MAG: class I SAM-dependent methyltransferase [Candidatus Omnitrophica bacterium]|nr:class I SAM-dependent methyltransferase [Candidatus Omnitrophota bacterium]
MKNETVNKYFDFSAINYNLAYKKADDVKSFIFHERKRIVLDMFDVKSGKVLDIGCGPAVYTDNLSEAGYEIYGVDSSERMIEIAKSKNFKNAKFFVGTVENIKFADNFFDGVLCVGVLEYLNSIEDGIKEIARVTKHGGIVIFTVPNGLSLLNKLDLLLRNIVKFAYRLLKVNIIKRVMCFDYESKLVYKNELDAVLERNGFKVENSRFHIFRLSFLNKIYPKAVILIAKKMNFISSPLLAINYVVKCRKT